ncbi:MAG: ABC transporter ATP-binding protein, partial [Planctomycetes bacterium]|nr:ABC transporter ATP-binding protein [Planctomycetota bacterium]
EVLSGLLPAERGEVLLDGTALPPGDRRLRARTGVVFQSPALDGRLGARPNLALAGRLYGLSGARLAARVEAMLAFAGLADRAVEPVKKLSGGMRRRLEIARAFLHEPDFLLLDEPTTGLDQASFERTWEMLRGLTGERGVAVLMTTHRADEAERCDRLGLLSEGKLVAVDTPEGLRRRLGGDVVEVDADDPGPAAAALASAGIPAQVRDRRVFVETEHGPDLVPRIAELLPRGSVRSIAVKRPNLTDAFLKLTGRTLGGGDA